MLRSGALGEDEHTTLDKKSHFPALVGFFHLKFLPFNLNLIYKQQCQKLPGWSKCFLDQGQLIPFISWGEKGCDFEQIHFIKKPHTHVAFRAADFRVKLP